MALNREKRGSYSCKFGPPETRTRTRPETRGQTRVARCFGVARCPGREPRAVLEICWCARWRVPGLTCAVVGASSCQVRRPSSRGRATGTGARRSSRPPVCSLDGEGATKPGQVGLVAVACLPLAREERIGLVQYQGVGSPGASGLMAHRQFGLVDSAMDVTAPLFCQRPFERTPRLIAQDPVQILAQFAAASLRQLDRPVVGGPGRPGQPGLKPGGAVAGDDVE